MDKKNLLIADLNLLSFEELDFYDQTCMRKQGHSYDPLHRIAFATVCTKYKRGNMGRLQKHCYAPVQEQPWHKDMVNTNVYEHTVLINMARERQYYKEQLLLHQEKYTKDIASLEKKIEEKEKTILGLL